ncbi:hypothetical protein GCM10023314_14110 [Algibacter agarivorans]|uniref:PKD domain-containing protein n=1 Tax=Algibacter agarivorans TaxID=1109741 RepID=A0ABP9GN29_9FLAO
MKTIKYYITFVLALITLMSCEEDNYEVGDIIAPSNVKLTKEIVGEDSSNPGGDGSGLVHFTATADNAITYIYNFGDNTDAVAASGITSHRFSKVDTNTYTVTVIASGTGGSQSTSSINIDVYSSFDDQEAKTFLTGGAGNSKKWYWAADKDGNIGLGPNDVQADGSHTYSAWFNAGPWWEDKLCMYDAEFVYSQSADGDVTFEQLTEIAYVNGDYANIISIDGNTCHGLEVAPGLTGVKTVTLSPSSSIATEDAKDPAYRGTTINISDGGFMCWYNGESSGTLEIIEITNSTLKVRVEDGPRAWYCFFQTEKPVQ